MLVYRLCRKDEIELIFDNRSFSNVGRICETKPSVSTHQYENGTYYLHFFKELGSLAYLYLRENRFICTYDIPDEILNNTSGKGYYLDYFNFERLDSCDEFAIPREYLKFAYLKEVRLISSFIDVEEYLSHDMIEEHTRVIYEQGVTKRLLFE